MFKWLYKLLGSMLSFFSSITGSYVLALLFYALIFKIVFIPFGIKQQKNQIKMAKLAPKIQLIKAKYKGRNDQRSMQKQQQEIMELQQKEGYNGCSGCMPLLIQLPIIMLLYAVIQSPITYMVKPTEDVEFYNAHYTDLSVDIPESLRIGYDENPNDGVEGDMLFKRDEYGNFSKDQNGNFVRVELTKERMIDRLYSRYGIDKTKKENKKANEITLISRTYEYVDSAPDEQRQRYIDYVETSGIDYDSIPNFRFFKTGVNLAETPSFKTPSIILIIPFLAAISSWLTMYLSRKLNGNMNPAAQGGNDQARQSMIMMDLMMPAMTLFFAFNFSGMLGIYWIIQSGFGLLQTFVISRTMPIPHYTEEELRELRRKEKEIEKAARSAAKETRHRSLHYIDEDDYDELPEAPQNEKTKKNTNLGGDAPEIKD